MGFHVKVGKGRTPAQNRAEKQQRVLEGRTHAALAEIARNGGGVVVEDAGHTGTAAVGKAVARALVRFAD